MKFEKSKVLHVFRNDLEQYIGKKCYCADSLNSLRKQVESKTAPAIGVFVSVNDDEGFLMMSETFYKHWVYAYPVPEKKLVPFDTVEELIDCWKKKHPAHKNIPTNCMPLIWIKSKDTGAKQLIHTFKEKAVYVHDFIFFMDELFRMYTFLDGTAIGKEVDEADGQSEKSTAACDDDSSDDDN